MFRNFVKGKKEYISKTFYKVDEAKAFAMNPNAELRRRKIRAAETAQRKTTRTEQGATHLQGQPDCREGDPEHETFYREGYEGSIYAHFPNLASGGLAGATLSREIDL